MILALTLPQSGRLQDWLQVSLSEALGAKGGRIEVGAAHINWTERTLQIQRLAYLVPGEALALNDLEVRLGWSLAKGFHVQQAVAQGGSLHLCQDLVAALEQNLQGTTGSEPSQGAWLASTPTLAIEDLHISLETPAWGNLELGVARACVRPGRSGRPQLIGSMSPAARGNQGGVHVQADLGLNGQLTFRAAVRELQLGAQWFPMIDSLASLKQHSPEGTLDLDLHGRWSLGHAALPSVEVLTNLRGGSFTLPWLEDSSARSVTQVHAELLAGFQPTPDTSFWDPQAWEGRASVSAHHDEIDLEGFALLGAACRTKSQAQVWGHVPRLTLKRDLVELLGNGEWAQELFEGLQPAGEVELFVGLDVPNNWDRLAPESLPRAVALVSNGQASCAYHGDPNPEAGGERNLGFPLRFDGISGLLTHLNAPLQQKSARLSLIEFAGRHGVTQVELHGSSHIEPLHLSQFSEFDPRRPQQFDLHIRARGLSIDKDSQVALQGLSGIEGCERLWDEYGLETGNIDLELGFARQTGQPQLSTDLLIGFRGAALSPEALGVRLNSASGQLLIQADGRPLGRSTLDINLQAEVEGGGTGVELLGGSRPHPEGQLTFWNVEAPTIDLDSPILRDRLNKLAPETLRTLDLVGLEGGVEARAQVITLPKQGGHAWLQVGSSTQPLAANPAQIPSRFENIRGQASVAIGWTEAPEPHSNPGKTLETDPSEIFAQAYAVEVGWWTNLSADLPLHPSTVPTFLSAVSPAGSTTHLELTGAGLDVGSPQVTAIIEALAGPESPTLVDEGTHSAVASGKAAPEAAGTLDYSATLLLAPSNEGGAPPAPQISVDWAAHLTRVGPEESPILSRVEGGGGFDGTRWTSNRLVAQVGAVPVEVQELAFDPSSQTSWLSARTTAQGLPIDERHLRHILDERTLTTLLGELNCKGTLDLDRAWIELTREPDASIGVHFDGPLTLHRGSIDLGLPVVVEQAEDIHLKLHYSGGRVRATARVEDLAGEVAGRKLSEASMQATYIDPRFTVEAFDGVFEGGRLESITREGSAPSGFFSLDFQEPYAFSLAGEMTNVDASQLLRGVFNSDFANQGKVHADIQLTGNLAQMEGIQGAGRLRLRDSGLWAIPVFQVLFSQLGFETAATFSHFDTRFSIAGGEIEMDHIRLKSDLLSLVGSGTVDLRGSIHHDLEVNYSLLDRLGPITRLIYKIQNSLLSVSIRGDLDRPVVMARGLFSQFFAPPETGQKLPLPAYSKRTRHF